MSDGGYGIYSGIGGLPYSVGATGSPTGQKSVDEPVGGIMARPTQAQDTPGAYGSDVYSSLMPQWMKDYFDSYGTGKGTQSLDTARDLILEKLPGLVNRYGRNTAMNPYFTKQPGAQKGFDPFNNPYYTQNVQEGRFEEYNPQFTYKRTITEKRDPFSGDVQSSQTQYDQTYGPSYQSDGGFNPYKAGLIGVATVPYLATKGGMAVGGAGVKAFKKGWK